jgi:hypothetical protein
VRATPMQAPVRSPLHGAIIFIAPEVRALPEAIDDIKVIVGNAIATSTSVEYCITPFECKVLEKVK